jgi:hypothetical protein
VFNASIIPERRLARNNTVSPARSLSGPSKPRWVVGDMQGSFHRRRAVMHGSDYGPQCPEVSFASARRILRASGPKGDATDSESGPCFSGRSQNAPALGSGSCCVQSQKDVGPDLLPRHIWGRADAVVHDTDDTLGLTSSRSTCRIACDCTPSDGGLECPLRR